MATDDPLEVENWVRERVLGSGGFGQVTLWRHKTKDEMIALKKCRTGTDALLTDKHKERWSKEVEIMQRLNHPNVVKAVPVPPDLAAALRSKLPLMCMEFCSKGDLRQVLNRGENCCGLREPEVRSLISDVKSAVHYLHTNKITHRDLKPENIVLQQAAERIVYKLIDLGYAKELDQSSICTSFVGTLQYLAPELFMSRTYNYSVDFWSLGLVSHEVITGVRPFLPNMAPAAWMSHVKEKSSDDISAYQSQDGTIVFSKELFRENHISSCLKYYVERWLKILLEWDAAKRGRALNKNKELAIVVFDLIEDIFCKKIVTIFCVPTYQNLSYEIDDSTAVSTLQLWIERDTGLSVQSQELLLPSGEPFDMTKEACQCWVPQKAASQDAVTMVYVYRRGSLKVEEVTPIIPVTVKKMMEEPRNLIEYIYQKRAWAHAVYFLRQETELYHSFLEAYRVKMLHLVSNSNRLKQKVETVLSQLQQVEAQYQLCSDSLQFDEEQAKRMSLLSDDTVQTWTKINAAIGRRLSKLKEVVNQLESKCEVVTVKTLELQRNPCMKTSDHDVLASLLEKGLKHYDSLRRRPKENRQQRMDSIDMVKVVYNCFKERDKLLQDKALALYLKQVVDVQAEIEQLWSPLTSSMQVISKVQSEVRQTQIDRQQDVWLQVAPDTCNGFTSHTKPPVLHHPTAVIPAHPAPSTNNNEQEAALAVVPPAHLPSTDRNQNESSLVCPPSPSSNENTIELSEQLANCSLLNTQHDTSAMISDNIALRYATQDLMNKSFLDYRKFLSEGQSLDWTFLETQD